MHALLALMLASSPASAPALASFEEDGGSAELVLVCEAPDGDRLRCQLTYGQVTEQGGVCLFRTRRVALEFSRTGPLAWSHTQTTPCDTQLVTQLSGTAGDKTSAASWAITQTRTGTPVDSDACKLTGAAQTQRFLQGGGKKRALKCTAVTMSLG